MTPQETKKRVAELLNSEEPEVLAALVGFLRFRTERDANPDLVKRLENEDREKKRNHETTRRIQWAIIVGYLATLFALFCLLCIVLVTNPAQAKDLMQLIITGVGGLLLSGISYLVGLRSSGNKTSANS